MLSEIKIIIDMEKEIQLTIGELQKCKETLLHTSKAMCCDVYKKPISKIDECQKILESLIHTIDEYDTTEL